MIYFSTLTNELIGTHAYPNMPYSSILYLTKILGAFISIKTILTNRYYWCPVISNGLMESVTCLGSLTSAYCPIVMSSNEKEFQLWLESGKTAP